ncbi:MAG TPA: Uma2 family endonuclease [Polyangiaceae bacterium]|nr:Uma2 family endonuclease [Polyangiaceae bacterium]
MPSDPARLRPSFDELYDRIRALGEGVTGQILEPGVVSTMSRPGLPHAHAESLIDDWLRQYDARRGGQGWWILREMEVRLAGDLLAVPDLAGWRVERVAQLPRENPLTVVPDWCCEVLSPTTTRAGRVLKLPLYARAGVRWTWLVEPEAGFVEVYESVGERPVRVASATDEERIVLPPFDGEAPASTWWMR